MFKPETHFLKLICNFRGHQVSKGLFSLEIYNFDVTLMDVYNR